MTERLYDTDRDMVTMVSHATGLPMREAAKVLHCVLKAIENKVLMAAKVPNGMGKYAMRRWGTFYFRFRKGRLVSARGHVPDHYQADRWTLKFQVSPELKKLVLKHQPKYEQHTPPITKRSLSGHVGKWNFPVGYKPGAKPPPQPGDHSDGGCPTPPPEGQP